MRPKGRAPWATPSASVFAALGVIAAFVGAGCSVGTGEGSLTGIVNDPECELEADEFDLEPTYFGAERVEGQLLIRIQRSSDFEDKSDGLIVLVRDPAQIAKEQLDTEVAVGRTPLGAGEELPVQMTFYMNHTCTLNRVDTPTVFEATTGTIRFERIYAPSVSDATRIKFDFANVLFVDPDNPDERNATLTGDVDFLYSRGRPAQRFP